jgi:hypothetical protein
VEYPPRGASTALAISDAGLFRITSIIFALVAVLHIWRIVAEWHGIDGPFLIVAATVPWRWSSRSGPDHC